MIAFANAAPPDEEIAAIVAALASLEPVTEEPAAPKPSPWKMAGRSFDFAPVGRFTPRGIPLQDDDWVVR